jgi:hypothetical protein
MVGRSHLESCGKAKNLIATSWESLAWESRWGKAESDGKGSNH